MDIIIYGTQYLQRVQDEKYKLHNYLSEWVTEPYYATKGDSGILGNIYHWHQGKHLPLTSVTDGTELNEQWQFLLNSIMY